MRRSWFVKAAGQNVLPPAPMAGHGSLRAFQPDTDGLRAVRPVERERSTGAGGICLGNLTAEEFLRKIDTTHELTSYEAGKVDLPDEPSLWQQLVARDFRFDPERYFPEKMAYLDWTDLTRGGRY